MDVHPELEGTQLASPIQLSDSPPQIDDDAIPKLDDDEEAERLRYRSWRQGTPDLRKAGSTQVRSKSGGSRLNRKIQATLPKAETQPLAARSRKSSHYLGLFKEKDAVDEHQQYRQRIPAPPSSDQSSPQASSVVDPVFESPGISALGESDDDRHGVYEALAHGGPQFRNASTSTVASRRSHPDLKAGLTSEIKTESSPRSPNLIDRDGQPNIPALVNLQLPPPAEVLEVPLRRKSSSKRALAKDKHRNGTTESEEEHSDREHISSATYYPHRQVRPDMSPELEGTVRPTLSRTQSAQVTIDQHEAMSRDNPLTLQPSISPEEVEISLQSDDNRQLWKGDYPVEPDSPDDNIAYTSSHDYEEESSMSGFESHDESAASTTGYDSDENVPTQGSSATPKPPRRETRKHTRDPLGAVELKPFNHQVGGHSTVYQFSRRAVCKQLNNRENVFYETVEKYHPELLEFMPR